jgi:hypothetical protein
MNLDFGMLSMVGPVLLGAVGALAGLGRLEPAAVLLSACDTLSGARLGPKWAIASMSAVDATLLERLGPKRVSELDAQGAALTAAAALAYLRAEAASVLTSD